MQVDFCIDGKWTDSNKHKVPGLYPSPKYWSQVKVTGHISRAREKTFCVEIQDVTRNVLVPDKLSNFLRVINMYVPLYQRWYKRPGRESVHLLPCSTEVNSEWSCTSISRFGPHFWTETTLAILPGPRHFFSSCITGHSVRLWAS